jgi:hypothetical protein
MGVCRVGTAITQLLKCNHREDISHSNHSHFGKDRKVIKRSNEFYIALKCEFRMLVKQCTGIDYTFTLLLLLLLSSSSSSSPLCKVFTIIYLKQTMFLGYIVLQQFCICDFCYM